MNFNAGCKTVVSNIVMAIAVMFTLLFLTPLFHYTPLVVLSSIIISAMLGLIDYQAAIHLWNVDKFDFLVCMSAYFGVVFGSVEIGLVVAVSVYFSATFTLYKIIYKKMITFYTCLNVICFFCFSCGEGGDIYSKVVAIHVKAENCDKGKHTKQHDL